MPTTSHGKRVAANVRAEMARRHRNQSSLAASVGMRQQALSRRLSGVTPFTIDELAAIADALSIPFAELVSESAA